MNDIKLICIDLDGTLLNDQNDVSKENLNAIHQLKKLGIIFCPCTGRSLAEIPDIVKYNDDIGYIIYSNGSAILDKHTNKHTQFCISKDSSNKIFELLSQYQAHLTIRHDGKCYSQVNDMVDFSFYNIIPAHKDVLENYTIQLNNFDDWKNSIKNIQVVSAFFHSYEDKIKCLNALQGIEDLLAVETAEYNIEIISKNAGKGNAISRLATILNIKKENVAAVGDSGNDIPMMNSAGLRLAVSNATTPLINVCDKTICSNNEHAVQFILNNFILKQ